MNREYHIETKCIQSGWKPKKGEPRMMPIYQSTTFKYDTTFYGIGTGDSKWHTFSFFRIRPMIWLRQRLQIWKAA